MGRNRKSESRDAARGVLDERRRLIAAGSLFAAVVVVLLLGAVLRTSEPVAAEVFDPLPARAIPPDTEEHPVLAVPAPAPASAPRSPPPERAVTYGDPLATRASSDRERLVSEFIDRIESTEAGAGTDTGR